MLNEFCPVLLPSLLNTGLKQKNLANLTIKIELKLELLCPLHFKDLFQDSVSALASLACNSDDDGAISKMSQVQPVLPQYLNKKPLFN